MHTKVPDTIPKKQGRSGGARGLLSCRGTGRILDISYAKKRYHGPKAIYSREAALLRRNGLKRVPTGDTITTSGGQRFRVYDWIPI